MKKLLHRFPFILQIAGLLMIPTMIVHAKEGMAITVSGPGIKGEVTIGSSDQLWRVEDSGFFGFSDNLDLIEPLENPGEGYSITASIIESSEMIPIVFMVYYPAEEGAGFVHYVSRINGDALQTVDEWARLSLSADKAFRALMESNGINLRIAVPGFSAPAAQPRILGGGRPSSPAVPVEMQTPYVALAVTAGILAVAGISLVLKKRTANRQSM